MKSLKLFDISLEVLGWLLLVIIWVLTIMNYNSLPEIITKHYNFKGLADSFGHKSNIWALPVVATVLFVGMWLINIALYRTKNTTAPDSQSSNQVLVLVSRLIRFTNFVLAAQFTFIAIQSIRNAKGLSEGLGFWYLPILFCVLFIPLIYFVIQIAKAEKSNRARE